MTEVFFVQYDEQRKERNLEILRRQVPWTKVIGGVKGVANAYQMACDMSSTPYFFVVDGDNEVLPFFDGEWVNNYPLKPTIFWSTNEYEIKYGHGAIKLLHKDQFLTVPKRPYLDITDILFKGRYLVDPTVLSHHDLGLGFQKWRTLFREITKLTVRRNAILQDWLKHPEPIQVNEQVCRFLQKSTPRNVFFGLNDYELLAGLYKQYADGPQ